MHLANGVAQLILVEQVGEIDPRRRAETMISPSTRVDIEKLVGIVTGVALELQLDEPVIADVSEEPN